MHNPFTLQMNFLCVKMICNTVLYNFINVYNILHCAISDSLHLFHILFSL